MSLERVGCRDAEKRPIAEAEQGDARADAPPAVVERDGCGNAGEREIAVTSRELFEGVAGSQSTARGRGNLDVGNELTGLERRREEARQRALEAARARFGEAFRARVLRDQVDAWSFARSIRAMSRRVRDQAGGGLDPATEEWLAWAEAYAESIDPTLGPLSIPEAPEPTQEELRPFLLGASSRDDWGKR